MKKSFPNLKPDVKQQSIQNSQVPFEVFINSFYTFQNKTYFLLVQRCKFQNDVSKLFYIYQKSNKIENMKNDSYNNLLEIEFQKCLALLA